MVRMLCSAAALAASGCIIVNGGGHGGGDGWMPCGRGDHDHDGPQVCARDRDCDDRDVCIDNFCRRACTADGACGEGHRCFRGLCEGEDQHPTCESHADCARDRVCGEGACVLRCEEDLDCDALADACSAGVCLPPAGPGFAGGGGTPEPEPVACRASCECPSGQECVDGACTTAAPRPEPKACQVDCECASGQRCVNGACS